MDELILRQLSGEATDVDSHRLEKWRASAPENDARFREMEMLWGALGPGRSQRRRSTPDIDAMLAEAERRRARTRASGRRKAALHSPWVRYGLAAAAGMALAVIGVREWQGRTQNMAGTALAIVESSAGPGNAMAMTLSDGSFARVAQGARLSFPVQTGRREVALDGAAFFAVATGSTPFVVRTAVGEVIVHGTRFEVRAERDALRVVVVEGVVRLTGRGGEVEVHPSQVGTLQTGRAPEVVTVADPWSLLAWPDGLLAFQRTPLPEVAAQLKHHFGVEVRIGDSLAATRRVTGSFGNEPLSDIVAAVCAVTGVRCGQQGDTLVFGLPPT